MALRRKISIHALSLTVCLVASLFVVQPAFAGKASFEGDAQASHLKWVEDHCVISPSVRVRIKGRGAFTLTLSANNGSTIDVVHSQMVYGPMDFTIHLHDVFLGVDGDSTMLEWALFDKRDRMRDFFAMGPYNCVAPA